MAYCVFGGGAQRAEGVGLPAQSRRFLINVIARSGAASAATWSKISKMAPKVTPRSGAILYEIYSTCTVAYPGGTQRFRKTGTLNPKRSAMA
jgi:hypothetical protein